VRVVDKIMNSLYVKLYRFYEYVGHLRGAVYALELRTTGTQTMMGTAVKNTA
jgi:hypothetical protein